MGKYWNSGTFGFRGLNIIQIQLNRPRKKSYAKTTRKRKNEHDFLTAWHKITLDDMTLLKSINYSILKCHRFLVSRKNFQKDIKKEKQEVKSLDKEKIDKHIYLKKLSTFIFPP